MIGHGRRPQVWPIFYRREFSSILFGIDVNSYCRRPRPGKPRRRSDTAVGMAQNLSLKQVLAMPDAGLNSAGLVNSLSLARVNSRRPALNHSGAIRTGHKLRGNLVTFARTGIAPVILLTSSHHGNLTGDAAIDKRQSDRSQ